MHCSMPKIVGIYHQSNFCWELGHDWGSHRRRPIDGNTVKPEEDRFVDAERSSNTGSVNIPVGSIVHFSDIWSAERRRKDFVVPCKGILIAGDFSGEVIQLLNSKLNRN